MTNEQYAANTAKDLAKAYYRDCVHDANCGPVSLPWPGESLIRELYCEQYDNEFEYEPAMFESFEAEFRQTYSDLREDFLRRAIEPPVRVAWWDVDPDGTRFKFEFSR